MSATLEPNRDTQSSPQGRPLVVALFLLLFVLLLLVPLPEWGRLGRALGDLLHAPAFAVGTVVIFTGLRRWLPKSDFRAAACCWAAMLVFGYTTEVVQSLGWRGKDPHDVLADGLGATAATLWLSTRSSATWSRWLANFGCLILLAAATVRPALVIFDSFLQARQFPQLASVEQPLEMSRFSGTSARLSRSTNYATDGKWSLKVEMKPSNTRTQEHHYSGVLFAPARDWSRYEELRIDVTLADNVDGARLSSSDQDRVRLYVRVNDVEHNNEFTDRYGRAWELEPGLNPIAISLEDVHLSPRGRTMDMRRIAKVVLFTVDPARPYTIYVDNIHLR